MRKNREMQNVAPGQGFNHSVPLQSLWSSRREISQEMLAEGETASRGQGGPGGAQGEAVRIEQGAETVSPSVGGRGAARGSCSAAGSAGGPRGGVARPSLRDSRGFGARFEEDFSERHSSSLHCPGVSNTHWRRFFGFTGDPSRGDHVTQKTTSHGLETENRPRASGRAGQGGGQVGNGDKWQKGREGVPIRWLRRGDTPGAQHCVGLVMLEN